MTTESRKRLPHPLPSWKLRLKLLVELILPQLKWPSPTKYIHLNTEARKKQKISTWLDGNEKYVGVKENDVVVSQNPEYTTTICSNQSNTGCVP